MARTNQKPGKLVLIGLLPSQDLFLGNTTSGSDIALFKRGQYHFRRWYCPFLFRRKAGTAFKEICSVSSYRRSVDNGDFNRKQLSPHCHGKELSNAVFAELKLRRVVISCEGRKANPNKEQVRRLGFRGAVHSHLCFWPFQGHVWIFFDRRVRLRSQWKD